MDAPTIQTKRASFSYANHLIFSELNLHLAPGKWTALIGPSGVGKTTLLRFLAGLTHTGQTSGEVSADNTLSVAAQIAYMAQRDLLLPWMRVIDNCLLSSNLRPLGAKHDQQKKEKAYALLSEVGLEKVAHHYPEQLSGGMRQRVALIRTLLTEKPIVLMDEPFSALDAMTRFKLHEIAVKLLDGKSVLFITHDPMECLRLAHHVYLMKGSPAKLEQLCSLDSVIPRPFCDPTFLATQQQLIQALLDADS